MKSKLPITLGVVGAVVGYVGLVALLSALGMENRNDPITSGLVALFIIGPIGAVGGLLLGVSLGRQMAGAGATGAAAPNANTAGTDASAATSASQPGFGITSVKAGLILVALIVAIGGAVAWYMI